MKPPTIDCPKCHGEGRIELPESLQLTLLALGRLKKSTAADVQRVLDHKKDFHITAFNNRLNELVKLGLATRVRQSRNWMYSVSPKVKVTVTPVTP